MYSVCAIYIYIYIYIRERESADQDEGGGHVGGGDLLHHVAVVPAGI